MTTNHAIIIAVGIALGGLLSGGIFELSSRDGTGVWRINKITGSVELCRAIKC